MFEKPGIRGMVIGNPKGGSDQGFAVHKKKEGLRLQKKKADGWVSRQKV